MKSKFARGNEFSGSGFDSIRFSRNCFFEYCISTRFFFEYSRCLETRRLSGGFRKGDEFSGSGFDFLLINTFINKFSDLSISVNSSLDIDEVEIFEREMNFLASIPRLSRDYLSKYRVSRSFDKHRLIRKKQFASS